MAKFNAPNTPSPSGAPRPMPVATAPSKAAVNTPVKVALKTEVRNSPVPKTNQSKPAGNQSQITRDDIARRAYEIWQSGKGGSEFDNWIRAERELRSS